MNKVVVIGSLNTDLVTKIKRLPAQGETVSVIEQTTNFGGKGANQAVAAARQGADVTFIGAVGNDDYGLSFKTLLQEESIVTDYIVTKEKPTGMATILLESNGHNTILVNGAANLDLNASDVKQANQAIAAADIVVAQLEVPTEAIIAGFKIAKNNGAITVLNPAPVTSHLSDELINYTDIIVPNESEAAALVGSTPSTDIAVIEKTIDPELRHKGLKNVIITLGDKGVYYHTAENKGVLPIFKVAVVDTTAAGDTFIGTLVAYLQEDMSNLRDVLRRSSKASALAVSKAGAITSIPYRAEVDQGLVSLVDYEVSQ